MKNGNKIIPFKIKTFMKYCRLMRHYEHYPIGAVLGSMLDSLSQFMYQLGKELHVMKKNNGITWYSHVTKASQRKTSGSPAQEVNSCAQIV